MTKVDDSLLDSLYKIHLIYGDSFPTMMKASLASGVMEKHFANYDMSTSSWGILGKNLTEYIMDE